ncbi:unnamed protein product, partial [Rotaria socialis]
MMRFLLIIATLLLSLLGKVQTNTYNVTFQIAVLLPTDPQLPYDMEKVKPAIQLA